MNIQRFFLIRCEAAPDQGRQGEKCTPSSACQSPSLAGCPAAVSVAWQPETKLLPNIILFYLEENHPDDELTACV